jgi:hypothetical protein
MTELWTGGSAVARAIALALLEGLRRMRASGKETRGIFFGPAEQAAGKRSKRCPQGLSPLKSTRLLSELKLRPPKNRIFPHSVKPGSDGHHLLGWLWSLAKYGAMTALEKRQRAAALHRDPGSQ